MPNDVLLTTEQVARRLDRSGKTIRRWAESGRLVVAQKLPGPNGALLFRQSDVDALSTELLAAEPA